MRIKLILYFITAIASSLGRSTISTALTPEVKDGDDTSYREISDWFKLRNDSGGALFSILMKTGSPLSQTSNYGGNILYNPDNLVTYQTNFGTYQQPTNFTESPRKELTTLGLGSFLQVGDRGSTLTFGANLNYFRLDGLSKPKSYLALLPTLGIRIESDAEMILHFEVGKNLNFQNQLSRDIGETRTEISVLNSTKAEASLGLGIGI
jgi:hypothetical protein